MISYIKPMQRKEFAEYLLTLKTGDTVEFATEPGYKWPDETPEINDCSAWYFARVMKIPEYDSRFILIDYAGGEEAFAIPLNCYKDTADDDDRMIVPNYVKTFFGQCCNLYSEDDYIFIEIKEMEN